MSPDVYVRRLTGAKPNLLVPHYLIACYQYYVLDDPLLSDATFEHIVAELEAKWDGITHPHKHLLDREFLKSGFHLTYPTIIKGAADCLKADLRPTSKKRRR